MKLNIQLFAASGSISCTQVGKYDIVKNTTVERITFTVKRTSGSTFWAQAKTVTFIINDQEYTSKLALPSSQTSSSCYVDVTVQHNADGSKFLEYSASIVTNTSAGTIRASGNKWLTRIPRASSITLSSNDIKANQQVTINITRASDTFTHSIYYKAPSSSSYIAIAYKVNTSYEWTPSIDLLASFPNSPMGIFKIMVETYDDDSYIGKSEIDLTIRPRGQDSPSYTLNISEGSEIVINSGIEAYVQNKSFLRLELNDITLSQGSNLSDVFVSILDQNNKQIWAKTYTLSSSASPIIINTDILNKSGTFTVATLLYDKRHVYAQEKTKLFTCLEYNSPKIESIQAVRSTSQGVESDSGTYLKYTFKASVTSLSNKNIKKYEIGYKKKSDSSYTYKIISTSTYNLNNQNLILSGVTLSSNYVYDLRFRVTDSFGETYIDRELGADFKLINFNSSGKSMAFGTVSNRGSNETYIDSNLTFNLLKGLELNGVKIEDFINSAISTKITELKLNQRLQKHIAVAFYDENVSILGSDITAPFSNAFIVGDKLSLYDGKIKIGKDVSKVKISASIFFEDVSVGNIGYIWCFVQKNDTRLTSSIMCSSNYFNTASITEDIIEVAEGDTLILSYNNPSSHTPVIRGGKVNSRLYVEVVE